jgi:hypothetical protein
VTAELARHFDIVFKLDGAGASLTDSRIQPVDFLSQRQKLALGSLDRHARSPSIMPNERHIMLFVGHLQ